MGWRTGQRAGRAGPQIHINLPDPETQLPLEELRRFTEVFDRIKKTYVEDVDDSTLLNNAIKGMLSGLDPIPLIWSPVLLMTCRKPPPANSGGIGIEVGLENGFIKVISPIDDTPATQAGIEAGDLIIKLDGETVKGMALEEAVKKMRGKPGSKLILTLVREGENAPIEKTVVRAVIQVASVKHQLLENDITTFESPSFRRKPGRTSKEPGQAEQRFQIRHKRPGHRPEKQSRRRPSGSGGSGRLPIG